MAGDRETLFLLDDDQGMGGFNDGPPEPESTELVKTDKAIPLALLMKRQQRPRKRSGRKQTTRQNLPRRMRAKKIRTRPPKSTRQNSDGMKPLPCLRKKMFKLRRWLIRSAH